MNEHLGELWNLIYHEIRESLPVKDKEAIAKLWFGNIQLKYMSGSNIYFSIDNYLKKKFIEEHKDYLEGFRQAIKNVLGFDSYPILICTERESFEKQFAELVTKNADDNKDNMENTDEQEENPPVAIKSAIEDFELPPEAEPYHEADNSKKKTAARHPSQKQIGRRLSVPRRYNPESGMMEERPLSNIVDETDDDGVLILGKSIPPCYPSYTFENFVVGNSNKIAYHYAYQASHYPAQQYNPLYIYGKPGLGKTHLLYAITNEIMTLNPDYNIIYVKAEDFTNELVHAIQTKTPIQFFREKYRTTDVLLIDDVQFIAGKGSTMEEFFHTFNALYESGKQIIMTSDKPPKDIKDLEERLLSRFEGGNIVKIDSPDIELRTAIIKKKFEVMKIDIPNEVVMFLSEHLKDNIRQIEGVIKNMIAYCHLMGDEKISLDLAERSISDIVTVTTNIDGNKIVNAAAEKYGISRDMILGKSQRKDIAWPRHMAIYAMKKLTPSSFSEVGKFFNRDHSTVIFSVSKIEDLKESDPNVAKEIQELFALVKAKC